ncbi:hypothetical protein Prudu_154S000500 [Prunus dulcis]|uniref:Uncharacterized protein n=2 Tax=Prunus dulcis TaxID=3755 RepID=A0A5H2XH63_PRUDU|nr:hypothetical protein Prudu_154S000500 [Prunus dulcis]
MSEERVKSRGKEVSHQRIYKYPPPCTQLSHTIKTSSHINLALHRPVSDIIPKIPAMSEEKHHHGLFHHHKDEDRPIETSDYPQSGGYSDEGRTGSGYGGGGGYGDNTAYSGEGRPGSGYGGGGGYGESADYSDGGRYKETAAYGTTGTHESEIDYKKEEKHHKHLEHLSEAGAAAAGVFALMWCDAQHEKHESKKDPEHAHKHKIEEEIAAAAAVGSGGFAFHEHHEKKEAKEEEEESHGKKHHHLF